MQRFPRRTTNVAAVCPVDCCVPDDDHVETDTELLAKGILHE